MQTTNKNLDWEDELNQTFSDIDARQRFLIKDFIRTRRKQAMLQAIDMCLERKPETRTIYPITNEDNTAQIWRDGNARGFNSALTDYHTSLKTLRDEVEKGEGV